VVESVPVLQAEFPHEDMRLGVCSALYWPMLTSWTGIEKTLTILSLLWVRDGDILLKSLVADDTCAERAPECYRN
jgi:hypothetical protein